VHIVAAVGLLGSVAAVLAINVRAASTSDIELAAASYNLLAMFTVLYGIPLSMLALASGVLLGLSSKWGVLRRGWVAAKLALLIGLILVGALVLGPGTDAMRNRRRRRRGALDRRVGVRRGRAVARCWVSVFKPRRRRGAPRAAAQKEGVGRWARLRPTWELWRGSARWPTAAVAGCCW
jgi:uncharacterized membrane protein